MKTRDAYFDNLKFVLIALVVIGHLIEPLYDDPWIQPLYLFIYTFHIPLFVLVSGYFSKHIGTADYFNKVISKLVIPYLIFQLLYSLFDYWVYGRQELTISFFTPYWLMWFFFSMILWKSIMPYMIRIKYALPLAVIIAVLAGYAQDAAYYASVSRTIVFFPFFLAGYYMDRSWIEQLRKPVVRMISLVVLLTTAAVLFMYAPYLQKEWLYGSFAYQSLDHNEWGAGLYRIAVYAAATLVGAAVMSWIPHRKLAGVSRLGANTLYVYLWHGFIIISLTASGFYDWFDSSASRLLLIPIGWCIAVLLSLQTVRLVSSWLVEPRLKRIFKPKSESAERKEQRRGGRERTEMN